MANLKLKRVDYANCKGCFHKSASVCSADNLKDCTKDLKKNIYYIFVENKNWFTKVLRWFNINLKGFIK